MFPNFEILTPFDPVSAEKCFLDAIKNKKPTYVRLMKGKEPTLNGDYNNGSSFKRRHPGKNNQNAAKLVEKYNDLAREALSNGDKILSENYLQHSEHFSRILISQENSRNHSENQTENSVNNQISVETDIKEIDETSSK